MIRKSFDALFLRFCMTIFKFRLAYNKRIDYIHIVVTIVFMRTTLHNNFHLFGFNIFHTLMNTIYTFLLFSSVVLDNSFETKLDYLRMMT